MASPPLATDDWVRCTGCGELVYRRRLDRLLKVCPDCGHHFRLRAREWFDLLLDSGSGVRFGEEVVPEDVLGFVDSKPYPERIAEGRRRSGNSAAALCATARIDGVPIVIAALDFAFLGGSIGGAVGELISRAARHALKDRVPLLIVSASGGARMQEGAIALMQLAKTSQEMARLHAAGVLVVNLNTDPTYGGASASFAMLGDVIIAEPGARIGFAGPEVIRQTIRQQLPDRFQTAEFLWENGQIDLVVPREELRAVLSRLLRLHSLAARPGLRPVVSGDTAHTGDTPVTDPALLPERDPAEIVALARDLGRPTTRDYCAYVFDDFLELHGDRQGGDDPAIVGGLARLDGRTVVAIGHQKGHEVGELVRRNFGMPQPWGYHKAHRLMDYAARFGLPLVTFVDTPGAYPGIEAEQRGQAHAIARCIMRMSDLPVPVVCVVTGEGGSGGALALAVGNRVLILENSYFSVISPEGCSTILFGDRSGAQRAAEQLRLTPRDLLRLGIVDGVLKEPGDGAHTQHTATAQRVKAALIQTLDELSELQPNQLVDQRYQRYARFGDPELRLTKGLGHGGD
ncbi:acetyl-CoA carboxylase carboxyltransferase subunit alpha [Streptomyces sp. NPDC087856]|uniref:acetyl-CoA carboxylase carboxyltransferase subunit alpha n=1 Tax=Streptomyces sp. NPDC087856 TaxID=3365811 RepID=UPI00380B8D8E